LIRYYASIQLGITIVKIKERKRHIDGGSIGRKSNKHRIKESGMQLIDLGQCIQIMEALSATNLSNEANLIVYLGN